MKTWTQMITDVHRQKRERDWSTLYWCIDLHDTIITGKYNKYNQPKKQSYATAFWIFAGLSLAAAYGVAINMLAHM